MFALLGKAWSEMTYNQEFEALSCSQDILDICRPIPNEQKEISEAWAVVKRIKGLILKDPGKWLVIDLCAGNALGSILASFLLPTHWATAYDLEPRKRDYSKVRKFDYIQQDIYKITSHVWRKNPGIKPLIIGIHPCADKAIQIINIYTRSDARALFLMPCCKGNFSLSQKGFLTERIGKYLTWCFYLASLCDGKIVVDKKCLSPVNAIITARK